MGNQGLRSRTSGFCMLTNHNFFAPNYFRLLVLVAPKSAWRLDRTVLLYGVAQCVTMRRYEKNVCDLYKYGIFKKCELHDISIGQLKKSILKTSEGIVLLMEKYFNFLIS